MLVVVGAAAARQLLLQTAPYLTHLHQRDSTLRLQETAVLLIPVAQTLLEALAWVLLGYPHHQQRLFPLPLPLLLLLLLVVVVVPVAVVVVVTLR
jgi:hypothetical protein